MLDYENEKNKAREFYKGLKSVFCHALKGNIYFNDHGFRHILIKNNRVRPKNDQIRRFKLLPYAPTIIRNFDTCLQTHGKFNASFWLLTKNVNGSKIKVLLRQIAKGEKHFFSIMD